MKTLLNGTNGKKVLVTTVFLLIISLPNYLIAQAYNTNGIVNIKVEGTSNLHDWILSSGNGSCTGAIAIDGSGNLTGLSALNFTMAVTTLKSEHGSIMDNNTYKAIAADKYPNIKFSSASATVKNNGGGNYLITAPGKLSISSGTRDITLTASCKLNTDKSVTINGSYKLATTDYNVKPISIMLGAIKTSENVNIIYNLVMKPQ